MKKDRMVGTRLPESLIADLERIERLEQTDRSTTVRKLLYRAVGEWKLEHYAQEYSRGEVTLSRAAEDGGVSVWEMAEYLTRRKIPSQYALDDLEHDLRIINSRLDREPER